VSVVIPTFNRSALLSRALSSVLRQTHQNLEIIVVDDASPDDTAEIVTRIDDERVRYLRHETNKGGSAARNTGIRAATGAYIAFLDDDDEWEIEKTREQLKALQKYDAVLCTSDEPGFASRKLDNKRSVDLNDLRRGHFTAGGTGVLMARADVLKESMFDESLPRFQDWDLFIRIAQRHSIGYINKPLVRYNEGAHGRISNKILNMPARELEAQLRMLAKHKPFFGDKWYRRHMCRGLLYGIKHRPDKFRHIAYMVEHYGTLKVALALARRFMEKFAADLR
jgi:glycosyltransferase involved in cell wall biosynthesis